MHGRQAANGVAFIGPTRVESAVSEQLLQLVAPPHAVEIVLMASSVYLLLAGVAQQVIYRDHL